MNSTLWLYEIVVLLLEFEGGRAHNKRCAAALPEARLRCFSETAAVYRMLDGVWIGAELVSHVLHGDECKPAGAIDPEITRM